MLDTGSDQYIVAPNPVYKESQLIFNNENQEKVTISFFDDGGKLIQIKTTSLQSVTVNRDDFKQGTYFFLLKSDGNLKPFSGKFSVN